MELWRHAAGLGACLPQEIWSSGGMLWRCGRGGAWRCRGMKLWSSVRWNIQLSFLQALWAKRSQAVYVSAAVTSCLCQDILLAFIASSEFLLQLTFQPSFLPRHHSKCQKEPILTRTTTVIVLFFKHSSPDRYLHSKMRSQY